MKQIFDSRQPDVLDLAQWPEDWKARHAQTNTFCGAMKIARERATKKKSKHYVVWHAYWLDENELNRLLEIWEPRGPHFGVTDCLGMGWDKKFETKHYRLAAVVLPGQKPVELIVKQSKMF